MIYEEAVYVPRPVSPAQVKNRANKFFPHQTNIYDLFGPASTRVPTAVNKPLAIVELTRTCRQIYSDLEGYPIFYRINEFRFTYYESLRNFLAAITPKRRAMIRRITVTSSRSMTPGEWCGISPSARRYEAAQKKGNKNIFALLCQLKDLRELRFEAHVGLDWYPYSQQIREVASAEFLTRLRREERATVDEAWSLWNLPQFSVTLRLEGDVDVNCTRTQPMASIVLPMHIMRQPQVAALIFQMVRAISLRRLRIIKYEEDGKGQTSRVTEAMVYEAIRTAGVDFAGEARVSQDRCNSTVAPVSFRTRGNVQNGHSVSDVAVVQHKSAKYDMEGLLTSQFLIQGIRHDGLAIECEVRVHDAGPVSSWEPLHTVLTESGVWQLLKYYKKELHKKSRDLSGRLGELRQLPPPKDIMAVSAPYMTNLTARSYKVYVREGKILQERYDARIAELEAQTAPATAGVA
jgi:hypothetical protein